MKNLNDIFSGAVLLCLCAVGAYEVSASIAPSDGEVVGADALPTLALGGMALCGVFLILQGLLRNRPGRSWGNRSAVIKTLLFFGFFVMYLSGMIWLGDRLVELVPVAAQRRIYDLHVPVSAVLPAPSGTPESR